jgi:HEAT repeat protein/outer membrane protein assembly factor BamB
MSRTVFHLSLTSLLAVFVTLSFAPAREESLHQRLKDSSAGVRKQAALTLAESNDAEAVSVLIDLLAELPLDECRPIEETLTVLAGEWAPISQLTSEDRIARKIRRDAWRAWWNNTDGAALLAVVKEHTLTPGLRQKIKELIGKLGDDTYAVRDAADYELHRLGRITLPQLRDARSSADPETATRAHWLVKRIQDEPSRNLPSAAVRLLALRKPPGAAEALLAYLPLAEDENLCDEVKRSLALLAIRDGKLDTALTRALSDDLEQVRAVVAEAMIQGAGKEGREAVRILLKDKEPMVRLRVALALVLVGEREAVPVLIDLLPVVREDQIGQVEDALHQLAGESAPETPWGTDEAERKKSRDAWAAWWKENSARVDLTRLSSRPWYGYTLLCDSSRNRVYEIDRNGKERWAIENVPFPVDAWVVNGNRVLIAEYSGRQVSERDFQGKIVWSKKVGNMPVNVQRLPNGNTFIATLNQILEVDRSGKEMYAINNVPGGITAAYRARDGRIICLAVNGMQCLFLDTSGKQLQKFAANRNAMWTSGIDLMTNGHILITQPNRNKVAEFDRNGKLIVEVNAPQVTTATALPNGHFLLASSNTQRAIEVDRSGKTVWEHRAGGNIFRARRR